ncbi:MAG: peptidoglycan DD-metalloendopeptidase family protein, partial [Oscillospiraceae bacterium]|nr:peptidoglycan DD-metalloendopeptidase family protein [Oscillospiraceae bacterium]
MPVIASPERAAKPEKSPQNPDASPGKPRLKFGAKPPKLTDDSKSPRKVPRLLFGIGKGVTSAKKEKVEKVEAELVIESDASGAKRRQRLRFERQERPVAVTLEDSAPDKKSVGTESKPQETELLTRTRPAKAKTDAANSERNADAEASPPKRRRLRFEPERKETVKGQTDEGFTRDPPKREDAEKSDTPSKKPHLRFEDKPDNKEQEEQGTRQTPSDAANQAAQVSESASAVRNAAVGNANANASDNVNAAMKSLLTRKDKEVIEAEARVEEAKRKLEKAKSKVPSKRRVKLEKEYDAKTGKIRRRLKFEKELMPEGVPLTPFPLRATEGINRSARTALWMAGHQKIRETERQNVGVEAAHKGELIAEQAAGGVLRWNRRRLREKPYRAVRQAERALQKEQVNLEWRRNLQEHPELKRKRALAKWARKQKIKRKYAVAAREAKKSEQHTQNVLNASGQIIRSVAQQVVARKSLLATVALLGMIVVMFSAGLTSCMAMVSSVQSSYISVSYMADEDDICESDLYYSEMETDLQIDINETETNHPGYDEYRYNIGEIGHNPYELLSYLSTKYNAFKFHRIRSNIADLFWKHYTLTRTVIVETRHDSEGNPYNWYVLKTTLSVRPLANVIAESLSDDEERTRYGLYMQTYGNRQAFGNPFDFAWLGRVSSPYGYRIHPITGAKNLHRGVDIAVAEGTVIKAVQDGRVVSAGENGGYGLCVVIQDNKGYLSRYAHCSSLSVHAGQRVKRGDAIAAVGSTGSSTGPHLHLEVMLDGEYLNPYFFVETGDNGNGATPGGGGVVIPGYPGEPPT